MNNDFNNPFAQHSETTSYIQESNQESDNEDDFLGEPRKVPASNYIEWIKGGWRLFREQPFMWSLAIFLSAIICSSICIVFTFIAISAPIFTVMPTVVIFIIQPIFIAGFMFACHKQYENGYFDIANIFSGFTKKLPQLLILSIFPLVLLIITFFSFNTTLSETTVNMANASKYGGGLYHFQMLFNSTGAKITLITLYAANIIYYIAMYLAPSLIIINNMSAIDALKHSLKAFSKNFLGAILLILAEFAIYFAIIIVLGIMSFALSVLSVKLFFIVLLIIFVPFCFCAAAMNMSIMYATYRDIFYK